MPNKNGLARNSLRENKSSQNSSSKKGLNRYYGLLAGLILFLLFLLFSVTYFPTPLNLTTVEGQEIIKIFRLPRFLTACLIGAGLALSGMVYQALLQNPLAEPFILGVASGAALGVALVIHFGVNITLASSLFVGLASKGLAAFLGALLVSILIYLLSFKRLESPFVLLLVGVVLNFFISSLILFLQVIGEAEQVLSLMDWMMGRLLFISYSELALLAIISFLFLVGVILLAPTLNLLSMGVVQAKSRGVSLRWVITFLFISVSLFVGYSVALSGPIGFVGLIAPHGIRLILGNNHQKNWPLIALLGANILVLADFLSQTFLYPAEIPVGVVMALVGAPFFLWLLLSNTQKKESMGKENMA